MKEYPLVAQNISAEDAFKLCEWEGVISDLKATSSKCTEVLQDLERLDRIHLTHAVKHADEKFSTNATVGLILVGRTVYSVVPGAPASRGGICGGDEIVQVDGVEVTDQTVKDAVIGDDKAGSMVSLLVKRNSKVTKPPPRARPPWCMPFPSPTLSHALPCHPALSHPPSVPPHCRPRLCSPASLPRLPPSPPSLPWTSPST